MDEERFDRRMWMLSTWHHYLDVLWNKRPGKMDWLGLESALADVLCGAMSDADKVAISKGLLDAYTRRKHFSMTGG